MSYADEDPAKGAWKRSLLDAREQARLALSECAGSGVDNHTPVDVPELVQYCHAQTLDYYRHVAPKRDGIRGGKWDDVVATVPVPTAEPIDLGLSDWYGAYDAGELLGAAEWTTEPVSLATLPEFARENTVQLTATVTHRATGETMTETRQVELHLPPAACDAILGQLDDCLEDLRWLPDAGDLELGADDVEVHY